MGEQYDEGFMSNEDNKQKLYTGLHIIETIEQIQNLC